VPDVIGFESDDHLITHHADHAERLLHQGISIDLSVDEYRDRAIAFMSDPLDGSGITIEGFRRSNDDRLRYDSETREFGVVCTCGYIRTYYILDFDDIGDEYFDDLEYFYNQLEQPLAKRPCCQVRSRR
jgi:hypothetical protein